MLELVLDLQSLPPSFYLHTAEIIIDRLHNFKYPLLSGTKGKSSASDPSKALFTLFYSSGFILVLIKCQLCHSGLTRCPRFEYVFCFRKVLFKQNLYRSNPLNFLIFTWSSSKLQRATYTVSGQKIKSSNYLPRSQFYF